MAIDLNLIRNMQGGATGTYGNLQIFHIAGTNRYNVINLNDGRSIPNVSIQDIQTFAQTNHIPITNPISNPIQNAGIPAAPSAPTPAPAAPTPVNNPNAIMPGDNVAVRYNGREINVNDTLRLPDHPETSWNVVRTVPGSGNNAAQIRVVNNVTGENGWLDTGNGLHRIPGGSDHTLSDFQLRPSGQGGQNGFASLTTVTRTTTTNIGRPPTPSYGVTNGVPSNAGVPIDNTAGDWLDLPRVNYGANNGSSQPTLDIQGHVRPDLSYTGSPSISSNNASNAWHRGWTTNVDTNGETTYISPDGKFFTRNQAAAQQYSENAANLLNRTEMLRSYEQGLATDFSRLANSGESIKYQLRNGQEVTVRGNQFNNDYEVIDAKGKVIAKGDIGKVSEDLAKKSFDDKSAAEAEVTGKPEQDAISKFLSHPAVAVPLAAMSAYGIYKGFEALRGDFSVMGLVNSAMGSLTFMRSMGEMLNKWTNGNGMMYAAAMIAVIAIIGLFKGKPKDNPLNTANGDPSAVPNANTNPSGQTGPAQTSNTTNTSNTNQQDKQFIQLQAIPQPKRWYDAMDGKVFAITAAGALMVAFGLDLSVKGPSEKFIPVAASKLIDARNAVDTSIGGGKIGAVDTAVLGKAYIQTSENNGVTPDKIVWVSQETVGTDKKPAEFMLNMVSLDYNGRITSPNLPPESFVPLFYLDDNKAVRTTDAGNASVGKLRAYAQASASTLTSPAGAATAANTSGAANHN